MGGTVPRPAQISSSRALASATEQHKKSDEYDLLTTYQILKMKEEDEGLPKGYAKNIVTKNFNQMRSKAEESIYDLGKYLVYLYTNCLVFNQAYGMISRLNTVEEVWKAVEQIEPKVLYHLDRIE